jgi:hypothetical protein
MIYISAGGEPSGPFEAEQVKQMLASGEIRESAFYWHNGLRDWVPVAQFNNSIDGAPLDNAPTPIAPALSTDESIRQFANTPENAGPGRSKLDPNSGIARVQKERLKLQASALAFYSSLDRSGGTSRIPFLLIDSKSLPRSGIHFLKKTLSQIFSTHFSFCEWYQEVGCCKSMPCALTCFADEARARESLRVRLIKSHDFSLNDPVYETGVYLRRLILLRQPLYILTSWFAVEQLKVYSNQLALNGIHIPKLYLLHEKEVISAAYKCLDAHFKPPSKDDLNQWLRQTQQYCVGFLKKWVEPQLLEENAFVQVLAYNRLPQFITDLFDASAETLTPEERATAAAALSRATTEFLPREDPFSTASTKISQYLTDNSMAFSAVAKELSLLPSMQFALGERSN